MVHQEENYFRSRARAERTTAEEASSPEARRAHLELALRYVKAAEALYVRTRGSTEVSGPVLREQPSPPAIDPANLEEALSKAFPLPASGAFSDLLSVID